MTDVPPPTSSGVSLALRAIVDHRLQTFPIKDGLTIGSDPDCDIRVPDALPKQIKVTGTCFGNWQMQPADSRVRLRDYLGVECAWLPLNPSTIFAVGATVFDCVWEITENASPFAAMNRHSCPRCRANLVEVDRSAKFCPHCGAPLPADCPEWPVLSPPEPPAELNPLPRWMMWLPPSLRARVSKDPLFFARRTTVLAYISTFFNLGLKHEVGIDGDRNHSEAMRYYQKAAHLGNLPARARLKAKENATA